eukprot:2920573-Rhodomonas_salina.1
MVYPTRNEGGKKPWAIKVTIKGGYCIMRKLTDMEAPFPNARFDADELHPRDSLNDLRLSYTLSSELHPQLELLESELHPQLELLETVIHPLQ